MENIRIQALLLTIAIIWGLTACSTTRLQREGTVETEANHCKLQFSTIKTLIILPIEIDGVTKNFLFDTGAEVTVLQKDTIVGKTTSVTGATNRSMALGHETISSLKIGGIKFRNTHAMSGNLVGLKEQIPNFGGIIGQPIISKTNWLINYTDSTIELSNQQLADYTFTPIKIKRIKGRPYVTLSIDGEKNKALIDLGSSSAMTIPEGSELASQILSKYDFKEKEREIYTIGGLRNTKEKTGIIPSVILDDVAFREMAASIRPTSQLRIGNSFFKKHLVIIDNINHIIHIKPNMP